MKGIISANATSGISTATSSPATLMRKRMGVFTNNNNNKKNASSSYQQVTIEIDENQYIYPPLNLKKHDVMFGHSQQEEHRSFRIEGRDDDSFSDLLQGRRDVGFRDGSTTTTTTTTRTTTTTTTATRHVKFASLDGHNKRKSDICEWPAELEDDMMDDGSGVWQGGDHDSNDAATTDVHPLKQNKTNKDTSSTSTPSTPSTTTSASTEFVVQGTIELKSFQHASGIIFQRTDEICPLKIKNFAPNSLFHQTDLKPGMVVLSINDREMTWESPKEAVAEIQKAKPGTITIRAIAKQNDEDDLHYHSRDPSLILMDTADDETSIDAMETDDTDRIDNKSQAESIVSAGQPHDVPIQHQKDKMESSTHTSLVEGMVTNKEYDREPTLVATDTQSEDSLESRQEEQEQIKKQNVASPKKRGSDPPTTTATSTTAASTRTSTSKKKKKKKKSKKKQQQQSKQPTFDVEESQGMFCNAFESSPMFAPFKEFSFVSKFPFLFSTAAAETSSWRRKNYP